MTNNVSGFIINKNNKLNINLILAFGNSCNRKILNINTFIIKNKSFLTWSNFFINCRVLRFFVKKYILFFF